MPGYHRYPTLSDDHLAFVCEDALWVAGREGGVARRLTSAPQRVHTPCFSPEGTHIAFTSNAEGSDEVYTIPVDGGMPHRLTYNGRGAQVVGFDPKGRVLIGSLRDAHVRSFWQIYAIDPEGGVPERLPVGRCRTISFDTDGDTVALGLNQIDAALWKRYRGGTAGEIWSGTLSTGQFKRLDLPVEGNHVLPTFYNGRIYFITDAEGWGNLWSCKPDGSGLGAHTHFKDFYCRFLRVHKGVFVFQKGARIWRYDTATGESAPIDLQTRPAGSQARRRFVVPGEHLQEVALAPDGKRLAATVRGKALAMRNWAGPTTWLGPRSGTRLRAPVWLHKSDEVALITDEGGESESLAVYSAFGGQRVAGDPLEGLPRVGEVAANPVRRSVALSDISGRVTLVDLDGESATTRTVYEPDEAYKLQDLAWSPDGRWLAFIAHYDWTIAGGVLYLFDTDNNTLHKVGGEDLPIHSPSFDPEGSFLFVLSERSFNPVFNTVAFGASVPRATRIYALVLSLDGLSPFDPRWLDEVEDDEDDKDEADKADTSEGDDKDKDKEKDDSGGPEPIVLDLEGLGRRMVVCPDVPVGTITHLSAAPDHKLLFLDWPLLGLLDGDAFDGLSEASMPDLICLNLKTGEQTTIMKAVESYEVQGDHTLIRTSTGLHVLKTGEEPPKTPPRPGPGRHTGTVDVDRLCIEITPQAEWRQMFLEAWRLQRDRFWTPSMAGIDWPAVRDHYLPLLERVHTRAELSDVIWEMHGELGTSHAYEFGGDYPDQNHYDVGHLGADLSWDGKGYRIDRILKGDSWDSGARSPLEAPGTLVREGDRILAIDGVALTAQHTPDEALLHRAGLDVELLIEPSEGGEQQREVVRTMFSEAKLRYRDWVERNRQAVRERSEGKLGYLHIPDMGGPGLSEFYRAWRVQSKAPGLVVDVRNNGGGFVSQIILEAMRRKVIGRDYARHGIESTYPADTVRGPIVAICDQFAGSDGDIFSHSFKAYGLGPLIGRRTWGGTIGIDPNTLLADGTIVTQPEYATLFQGVGWDIENYGVDPDIDVDLDPASAANGQDPQLDKAIEVALGLLKDKPVDEPPPPAIPTRKF